MQFPKSKRVELELTSKCTIICPNCPRTYQADKRHLWDNGHIDADKLIDFLKLLPVNYVQLTGAYGDGIYHPHLVKVIKAIKEANLNFNMDTNGSYRKATDWEQIADLMTDKDLITFSIDGTPENFTQYRVNADWPSIKIGIETLAKQNKPIRWKYIVFKYNCSYEDMKTAYDIANRIGVTQFEIIDTHRAPVGQLVDKKEFNKNLDQLELYVDNLKNSSDSQKTKVTNLTVNVTPRTGMVKKNKKEWVVPLPEDTKETRPYGYIPEVDDEADIVETKNVYPQCMNVKDYPHFITSEGLFLPCCFMRVDQQNWFDQLGITKQDIESMSIYKHTHEEIINGPAFKKIMNNFENLELCRMTCGKKSIARSEKDAGQEM